MRELARGGLGLRLPVDRRGVIAAAAAAAVVVVVVVGVGVGGERRGRGFPRVGRGGALSAARGGEEALLVGRADQVVVVGRLVVVRRDDRADADGGEGGHPLCAVPRGESLAEIQGRRDRARRDRRGTGAPPPGGNPAAHHPPPGGGRGGVGRELEDGERRVVHRRRRRDVRGGHGFGDGPVGSGDVALAVGVDVDPGHVPPAGRAPTAADVGDRGVAATVAFHIFGYLVTARRRRRRRRLEPHSGGADQFRREAPPRHARRALLVMSAANDVARMSPPPPSSSSSSSSPASTDGREGREERRGHRHRRGGVVRLLLVVR